MRMIAKKNGRTAVISFGRGNAQFVAGKPNVGQCADELRVRRRRRGAKVLRMSLVMC